MADEKRDNFPDDENWRRLQLRFGNKAEQEELAGMAEEAISLRDTEHARERIPDATAQVSAESSDEGDEDEEHFFPVFRR